MPLPLEKQTTDQLKGRRAELVTQIDEGRFKLAHRVVGRERTHANADVINGRLERNAIDAILLDRGIDMTVPPHPPPTEPPAGADGNPSSTPATTDDTPPEPIVVDDGEEPVTGAQTLPKTTVVDDGVDPEPHDPEPTTPKRRRRRSKDD